MVWLNLLRFFKDFISRHPINLNFFNEKFFFTSNDLFFIGFMRNW